MGFVGVCDGETNDEICPVLGTGDQKQRAVPQPPAVTMIFTLLHKGCSSTHGMTSTLDRAPRWFISFCTENVELPIYLLGMVPAAFVVLVVVLVVWTDISIFWCTYAPSILYNFQT